MQAVEWVQTISMSPAVVKQLMGILQTGIDGYEKQYGKIPEAPKDKA